MRNLISWNVNGLRAVEKKGELARFLQTYQPDIFFIQETKAKTEALKPIIKKYSENYEMFFHEAEKPGYAGSAIWVHQKLTPFVQEVFRGFPEDIPYKDTEGRICRIDLKMPKSEKTFALLSVYFPNGGKSPEAWEDKLVFYERFLTYINRLREKGLEVIWTGDINCAHQPIDLARPKDNEGAIGFHPKERAWIDKVIAAGWRDVFRSFYPEKVVYSWWHLLTKARARNVGWRIDYFFVDEHFLPKVEDIQYLTEQMGSDHCPVQMLLKKEAIES